MRVYVKQIKILLPCQDQSEDFKRCFRPKNGSEHQISNFSLGEHAPSLRANASTKVQVLVNLPDQCNFTSAGPVVYHLVAARYRRPHYRCHENMHTP